jgi:hypothetical protein
MAPFIGLGSERTTTGGEWCIMAFDASVCSNGATPRRRGNRGSGAGRGRRSSMGDREMAAGSKRHGHGRNPSGLSDWQK